MDTIYKRRSYHAGFDSTRKISDNDIKEILKAGMNAPSGRDTQPWEFVVIDDKKLLVDLGNIKESGGAKACATASHAILICSLTEDFAQINIGLSAQNIVLTATELNIGSLIMGIYPDEIVQARLHKLLNIPDDYNAYIMIALGYSTEILPPNDRFVESKIHRNKW